MTWSEYANMSTELYNDLRRRGYSEKDIWHLIDLYFTSGAYRAEQKTEVCEEDDA